MTACNTAVLDNGRIETKQVISVGLRKPEALTVDTHLEAMWFYTSLKKYRELQFCKEWHAGGKANVIHRSRLVC
jgi:hypothetical protein